MSKNLNSNIVNGDLKPVRIVNVGQFGGLSSVKHLCERCIKGEEFLYVDEDGNVKLNGVRTYSESSLFAVFKKQAEKEGKF